MPSVQGQKQCFSGPIPTAMTTRAEEIVAEGPYNVEKDAPINEWRIVYGGLPRMTFAREWTAICVCRELNAAYKQGQQDRWISEAQPSQTEGQLLVGMLMDLSSKVAMVGGLGGTRDWIVAELGVIISHVQDAQPSAPTVENEKK